MYRVPTQIVFSKIPCVFPVRPHIFPVPISIICDYYIHKTGRPIQLLEKNWKFSRHLSQYPLPLASGNLQLEQTKFPVFSLCFGKISKFPVFSLTGIFFCHFPRAVGTLKSTIDILLSFASLGSSSLVVTGELLPLAPLRLPSLDPDG